jgi:hypothetical protein
VIAPWEHGRNTMSSCTEYTMTRFLDSKRTVDDRALNKDVVGRLREELESASEPLQILEVGAGLGTMIARLVEWRILTRGHYTLLDMDPQLLIDSRTWLKDWAKQQGLEVTENASTLRLHGESLDLEVAFVEAELREYLGQPRSIRADLLIANAFLDLVDVSTVLPDLLQLVRKDGLYWFTINFDGHTLFQPGLPADDQFMQVYHQSMDDRTRDGFPAGDSQTGRHLFGALRSAGASLLASGSSDWVIFSQDGVYPGKESYFLHHILNTIDLELQRHAQIDPDALRPWIQTRHRQVDEGELVYLAHQLDFLGRVGG